MAAVSFPESRIQKAAVGLATALLATALVACGGDVIDSFKTEAAVLAEVQVKTATTIESAECPNDVDVVTGTQFSCTVTAEGGDEAIVDLKILNDNADVDMLRLREP